MVLTEQDKKILEILENSYLPIPTARLGEMVGIQIREDVKACIGRLRKAGYKIKAIPGKSDPKPGGWAAGYYLEGHYTPPVPKRRQGKFFRNSENCENLAAELAKLDHSKPNPYRIRYPVDWTTLRELLVMRGFASTGYGRYGKAFAVSSKIPPNVRNYLASVENRGARPYARTCEWPVIVEMADLLEVPAEVLVDEDTFLFSTVTIKNSNIPLRYAGYKLLFSALRHGMDMFDLMHPAWLLHEDIAIDDVRSDYKRYPHLIRRLKMYLTGSVRGGRNIEELLYMCAKSGVHPSQLFTTFRRRKKDITPLALFNRELAAIPEDNMPFLIAVTKLLSYKESRDNDFLKKALVALVDRRDALNGPEAEKLKEHTG